MDKIKTFFAGILAALLAAIYFFAQSKPTQPKDPFEDEQKDIEAELAKVEAEGVEAEELSAEEAEEFWKK